jgi:hypothetical protein
MSLHIAQDEAADDLLDRDPLALLLGMALDQRSVSPLHDPGEASERTAHHAVAAALCGVQGRC